MDSLVGDNLVVFYYLRESEFWNGKGWALVGGALSGGDYCTSIVIFKQFTFGTNSAMQLMCSMNLSHFYTANRNLANSWL